MNSETLELYFTRSDTPAKGSPVVRTMHHLNAIYPDVRADELRALANQRIHSGGPGKVKWSREESRALKNAGVLPDSTEGERFSRTRSGSHRDYGLRAQEQPANVKFAQEVR